MKDDIPLYRSDWGFPMAECKSLKPYMYRLYKLYFSFGKSCEPTHIMNRRHKSVESKDGKPITLEEWLRRRGQVG